MDKITIDQYAIELTNINKVLFPEDGITKSELVDYYVSAAGTMLPHVQGRPVTLQRFPEGVGEHGFFQKEAFDYFPEWVERVDVETREDEQLTMAVCNNKASIVYFAELDCIALHTWLSRIDRRDNPDKLVFDLDPPGGDFNAARLAAIEVHSFLQDELGLPSFAMTTGGCGIHVVIPLDRSWGFDDVRPFAEDTARYIESRHPDRFTTEQRIESRNGRIYIDVFRNSYGQTSVAPYSVRPRAGAPVATPVEWSELDDPNLHPQRFNLRDFLRKPDGRSDPWARIWVQVCNLDEARDRLDSLYSEVAVEDDYRGRTH